MGTRAQAAAGRSRTRRGVAALGVLAAAALALTVAAPALQGTGAGPLGAREAAASDASAALVGMINDSRQRQGLGPLTVAGDLTSLAAERARVMADAGALSHTPDLGDRACCWTWIAENVGYAYSVSQTHDMFMGSSGHRANILAPQATDVGVAVVTKGGTLWVAEVFRARTGGGDRSSDASQPSRSGDRDAQPADGAGAATSVTTTTTTTTPTAGSSEGFEPPARVTLEQRLHRLRADLRERLENGRLDPLRSAVVYAGTLDRVSR